MNARGKNVDTTYLSMDHAEERGFIHRDYIAHCLRWSHVVKRLGQKHGYRDARLLDVGCGRELPLAKLLYSSKYIPSAYYGVDYGPLDDTTCDSLVKSGKFPGIFYEKTDLCHLSLTDLASIPVNWITCFEVLEHVEPAHLVRMLRTMRTLASEDAKIFISTPCWNEFDCAANHVNEIKYEVLGSVFERLGFGVVGKYGTFASIRDYHHMMLPDTAVIFDKLRAYYDTNFLSCVFAPLFPSGSRNVLWELSLNRPEGYVRQFSTLTNIPKPWGSSTKFEELANLE